MKKRNMLTLMLIAILAIALGLGTMAKYNKSMWSGENKVRAARFEVSSNGTLSKQGEFDLSEDPIYPGYENEKVYEFEIDKKNTEVPVRYNIGIEANGELFEAVEEGNSPVVMTLYREIGDNWEPVENELEINPVEKDVEKFRIGLKWNDSDYDILYQNKSGNITINVLAEQVQGNPGPGELKIVSLVDPAPITVTVGDPVTMPITVIANLSDNTTKDVPVTWNPAAIDTTTAGTKTATGTVDGYDGNVTLTVTVEEAAAVPMITNFTYRDITINMPTHKLLKGLAKVNFANLPEEATHYYFTYTVKSTGKSINSTKATAENSVVMVRKSDIQGGKVDIIIYDNVNNKVLYTFKDVSIP